MYELSVHLYFSSAHNLRGYEGACENLHGHNWKVEARVEASELDHIGMALDFKRIKSALNSVVDSLDHKYLNETPPFDSINPTAENLARHIFEALSKRINDERARVARITVWESENAAAAYYE